MLKSYGRFELLELIYNMRKENLELKERCETAERKMYEIQADADKKLDTARKDFETRIEELRMQGAAKDLQIRMKKIEEQLRLLQRLTSIDIDLPTQEEVNRLAQDIENAQEQESAEEPDGKEELVAAEDKAEAK